MAPPVLKNLVAHVFLIDPEDGSGLILVDTGFGTKDIAAPRQRLGIMRHILRPQLDLKNTALHQLKARGIEADEVAHIVLTHLDLDHAGGLADFPDAYVHVTTEEHRAAITHPHGRDKSRYRSIQFDHYPNFRLHKGPGDEWRKGLRGHEVVPGVSLVPLSGHSRGHAAVVVETADRGLLVHAGDASFDASHFAETSITGEPLDVQQRTRLAERFVASDLKELAKNQEILRQLNRQADVTIVNAHDPRMFEGLQSGTARTAR